MSAPGVVSSWHRWYIEQVHSTRYHEQRTFNSRLSRLKETWSYAICCKDERSRRTLRCWIHRWLYHRRWWKVHDDQPWRSRWHWSSNARFTTVIGLTIIHYTHIKSMSQNPLLSQARALRERLSNPSPSEQEEQEYLSELIEIERASCRERV